MRTRLNPRILNSRIKLRRSRYLPASPAIGAGSAEAGFSLVEILMGVIILVASLGMAGAMNGVATRSLRSSTIINDRNAAVDADIAMIRSMAERYTWCSGAPDLVRTDSPTCLGDTPADESYFSPAVSQDDANIYEEVGNPQKAAFEQACQSGTLNDNLIDRINARSTPQGLTRTASVIKNGGATTSRIQILYASPSGDENSVVRSVVISPPVAAFCP